MSTFRSNSTVYSLVCATAIFAAACGSDKDKKPAQSESAPTVEITGVQNQAGGSSLVTYKADQTEVTYECKAEQGSTVAQWAACPETGYVVQGMNGTVLVSVRAKKGSKVSAAVVRMITLGSEVKPVVPVGGEQKPQAVIAEKQNPQSVMQQNGEMQITFTVSGADASAVRFECKVGEDAQARFEPCQSPLRLQGQMAAGIKSITVRPILLSNNQEGIADMINFVGAQMPTRQAPTEMLLGNFYKFTVPQGMHVTEYSSSATIGRTIDAFRIRTESDPTYVGNTRCDESFSTDFMALSPAGEPLKYCNFTPNDNLFKYLTDARWANNHLAVGTDASVVGQNPQAQEAIMINLFDQEPEFRRERTRFWDLCKNAVGGRLDVINNITLTLNFWGMPVQANFWTCTTVLSVRKPNGLPEYAYFRVGTFFITDRDEASGTQVTSVPAGAPVMGGMPNMNCATCSYSFPHLMEVVYVARANDTNITSGFFAQTAQRKFIQALSPANY